MHARKLSFIVLFVVVIITPSTSAEIDHQYLGQGLDADGWTTFESSNDTTIIYVSSSQGSDSNHGLSPEQPVKTLAQAYSLLTHGKPDWMLLKRGDTWTNEMLSNGNGGRWQKSGKSRQQPLVIGSYGSASARPKVRTGDGAAFVTMGGGGSPDTVDHIAIVGIHLVAHTHDGVSSSPSGISMNWQTENLLIEDCFIERYEKNISISAPNGKENRNIIVRRNVIVDAFHSNANAQGYWNGHRTYDVLIEENIVDHNGWVDGNSQFEANTHNHNMYINGPRVTVRRNIVTNGSSHGLQLRHNTPPESGTNVQKYAIDNVFSRNSIAVYVNAQGSDDPGAYAEVRGNVILDGKDITPDAPRGAGIDFSNALAGLISDNIIANNTLSTGNQKVIDLDGGGIGVHNTVVRDNISWKWPGYLGLPNSSDKYSDITIENTVIQGINSDRRVLQFSSEATVSAVSESADNNFYNSGPPSERASINSQPHSIDEWADMVDDPTTESYEINSYPEPDRTLASYASAIGLSGTHDAFVSAARLQQKGSGVGQPSEPGSWNQQLTADAVLEYIRDGFDADVSDHELCAGDVTENGVVDVDDLLLVVESWGPCSGSCAADVNGDGVVDVFDLLLVMKNWGSCN